MPNGWEWAVLALIALLLFGGSRLSGIGRSEPQETPDDSAPVKGPGAPPAVEDEVSVVPQAAAPSTDIASATNIAAATDVAAAMDVSAAIEAEAIHTEVVQAQSGQAPDSEQG